MEPHGTIIAGRWAGTRGSLVEITAGGHFIIRPFNDTAQTEDARIHLSPTCPIKMSKDFFKLDKE